MNEMKLDQELRLFCERLLPRMLTQVCRDPGSPAYGSFDRNWWHYKIRDFSSIILQQGGYALYCASCLPQFGRNAERLRDLAAASCRFWNRRAQKFRAFEEYYPWEEGYPPLAFSTLAVAKMVAAGVVEASEVFQGLEKAAKQLQSRFEPKATNQQAAGMAALCWIRKVAPELIDESSFQDVCSQTLACQHKEGWFLEYGGPDLGYLSVTMDCLWDAFDATGDKRFKTAAATAMNFIAPFVALPMRGAGMHNARNTDYIVPYGIARFLEEDEFAAAARMILFRILETIETPGHFLHAVDDRYYCHYIGHSLFRAAELSGRTGEEASEIVEYYFEGTGQWLRSDTPSGCAALVSAKKGGIISLSFDGAQCADFGWIVSKDGKEWVSHWWADFWKIERTENSVRISGHLMPHLETVSSPFKHMALRGMSLLFGRRIIGALKEKMIFKNKQSVGPSFSRRIEFRPEGVEVLDTIGADDVSAPVRAPRSSKRHVASADSYHCEDLQTVHPDISVEESRSQNGSQIEIITTYKRKTT